MKIVVAYICVTNGEKTENFAARFVSTYLVNPPGHEHDTVIICNGGPLSVDRASIFTAISCKFFPRSNVGWDISGYIEAARGPCAEYDLMVCMGESVHFNYPNWLGRLVECVEKHGQGMYGFFSSYVVRAHLNTTAFAAPPKFIASYPIRVITRMDRYEFEHGKRSLWRRLAQQRIPSWLVTWDGCWAPTEWRKPPNILWRGDQSNMLIRCNHADAFDGVPFITRAKWQQQSDQPFR